MCNKGECVCVCEGRNRTLSATTQKFEGGGRSRASRIAAPLPAVLAPRVCPELCWHILERRFAGKDRPAVHYTKSQLVHDLEVRTFQSIIAVRVSRLRIALVARALGTLVHDALPMMRCADQQVVHGTDTVRTSTQLR